MMDTRPFTIAIDARIELSGENGGVEQFIIGLADGLGSLSDGPERYVFVVYRDCVNWLCEHIRENSSMLLVDPPLPNRPTLRSRVGNSLPLLRQAYRLATRSFAGGPAIPSGLGIEIDADVIHLTKQWAFSTQIPSIYHPHDLQHLHHPKFFDSETRRLRQHFYKTFCDQARVVAVASSWTKQDVITNLQIRPDKIHVVPLAPPNSSYPDPTPDDIAAMSTRFQLPDRFIFYPAQTWPHKNHITLLEALSSIKNSTGTRIPLVCSGKMNAFFPEIQKTIVKLQLEEDVFFLGFVSPMELQCLYQKSVATVIPTKFEAASFPMWEAFQAGSPVACSNVTSLPAQAGDTALIFDPNRPEEIAAAVQRLWTDQELCRDLTCRASARLARFTWDRTARHFRALYRNIGGQALDSADREILAATPLL